MVPYGPILFSTRAKTLDVGWVVDAGTVDELIQALVPNRVFYPEDILFNAVASTIAVTSAASIAAARRRSISLPGPGAP